MKNIEFNKATSLSPYPYISHNFFLSDTVLSYITDRFGDAVLRNELVL